MSQKERDVKRACIKSTQGDNMSDVMLIKRFNKLSGV